MLSRPTRLAAPFVVVGLIAAGAIVPTLQAGASPKLPAITAKHLVEKVLDEKVSHLSGTFQWKANLGLPSLSALTSGNGQSVSTSSGFDPTSLLSGTHNFEIWIDGAARQRLAAPASLAETDIVRRGHQAWLYDSSTNHVTHYVMSCASSAAPTTPMPDSLNVTAVADKVLSRLRSVGTVVSVGRPAEVAGRAAYVLRLAPDRALAVNRASTVSAATIAVDAKTGLPLRVSIFAVGQKSPALQVGYSSISFARPSGTRFAAPVGQTTSTKVVGCPAGGASRPAERTSPTVAHSGAAQASSSLGRDWGSITQLPAGTVPLGVAAGEVDSVSTVVSGSWGSGRLVESTLVNALLLANGRVLIGLVTPAALEAAAGQLHS